MEQSQGNGRRKGQCGSVKINKLKDLKIHLLVVENGS
jgi:hypothetical protein